MAGVGDWFLEQYLGTARGAENRQGQKEDLIEANVNRSKPMPRRKQTEGEKN